MGLTAIRPDIHERFVAIVTRATANADREYAAIVSPRASDEYAPMTTGLTPSRKSRRCLVTDHYAVHKNDRIFQRRIPKPTPAPTSEANDVTTFYRHAASDVHAVLIEPSEFTEEYDTTAIGDGWAYQVGRRYIPRDSAPWTSGDDAA